MPQLVTVQELAKLLNVPVSWIYQQTRQGPKAIPFVKVGKYIRFDPEEVVEFLRLKGGLPARERLPVQQPRQFKNPQPEMTERHDRDAGENGKKQTLDAIEDRIADLVAEALFNRMLRKGLLKEKP